MFHINERLGMFGATSTETVTECVPLSILEDDEIFFNYIADSNERCLPVYTSYICRDFGIDRNVSVLNNYNEYIVTLGFIVSIIILVLVNLRQSHCQRLGFLPKISELCTILITYS